MKMLKSSLLIAALLCLPATSVVAEGERIGEVKTVQGEVTIERVDEELTANPGTVLYEADVIRTGSTASVGMSFTDDSQISLGPSSELSLEKYLFSAEEGAFDARLNRGLMTAASGKIAKKPMAMRVLIPTGVLGVRGTEFAVRVSK